MPYTAADVRQRTRILRLLLGGPPKAGKSVAAIKTAPRPVYVFNTDGRGALDPAVALGAEFSADDIKSMEDFDRAFLWLKAHSKEFVTVVFDNLTNFGSFVEMKLREDPTLKDGRQLYPALERALMEVFNKLLSLPQHLILVAHILPGESGVPGGFDHMLGIAGGARTKIAALMQDWVWLNVEVDAAAPDGVRREFLLAPQGNWTKGVRSIQHTKRMPADVSLFIKLMNSQSETNALKAAAPKVAAVKSVPTQTQPKPPAPKT